MAPFLSINMISLCQFVFNFYYLLFPFQNSNSSLPNTTKGDSNVADVLVTQFRKLMTTNLVVRLNNFTMWKVSTSKVKMAPREFLSGKLI